MNIDFEAARRVRPLTRVIAEEGADPKVCPICHSSAAIETIGHGYTDSFIDRVRESTDIVALAERLFGSASLKKQGASFVMLCPFHSEKTPSCGLVPKKRIFKCFGCGAGGDCFKLLTLHQGIPFPIAVAHLAAAAGIAEQFEHERSVLRCSSGMCPAATDPLDEAGWLAAARKLSRESAFVVFLQEAGIRTGELHSPSLLIKGRRKGKLPRSSPDGPQMPTAIEEISDPGNPPPRIKATPGSLESPTAAVNVAPPAEEEDEAPLLKAVPASADLVRKAIQRFYGELDLTRDDMAGLYQKRGLRPQTLRAAGIRSNGPANLEILNALGDEYPVEVLLRSGLWERMYGGDEAGEKEPDTETVNSKWGVLRRRTIDGCTPSRFYFGMGVTGTQRVDGVKKMVYGWNQAPLIPYFDRTPLVTESTYDRVCVTEGELKCLAWWQWAAGDGAVNRLPDPDPSKLMALRVHKHWGKGASAQAFITPPGGGRFLWMSRKIRLGFAAVPGTSFVRRKGSTTLVRDQLDLWAKRTGAEELVVCFDNEDKSDPALPGYNPNVEDRFDPVAWGLFLARDVWKIGLHGRFMTLPDSSRDAHGKADWDGVLSQRIHQQHEGH